MECTLCPRMCRADRSITVGFCGVGEHIAAARADLHFYEEPIISGKRGSGAVFFSGCSLKCVFCQNEKISHGGFGKEISPQKLADIFFSLEARGAHNINLVTPSHFTYPILKALDIAKPGLKIPVVFNSSGYERVETLRLWEGYVDIYLPDLKYFSPALSKKYSGAENYLEYALPAIAEMKRQAGNIKLSPDGMLKRGLVVRHLVLPGCHKDSINALNALSRAIDGKYLVSIMRQYTPTEAVRGTELDRRVFTYEYKKVLECAEALGLDGFCQQKDSATAEFTPSFDLTGI